MAAHSVTFNFVCDGCLGEFPTPVSKRDAPVLVDALVSPPAGDPTPVPCAIPGFLMGGRFFCVWCFGKTV